LDLLRRKTMIHITHTGYHAGQTWCGETIAEGDRGAHYSQWVHNPAVEMCPRCREILDTEENDDE
jgi:hypothetical protein